MEKRIEALIRRMTLEEKVSLLSGIDFWHTRASSDWEYLLSRLPTGPTAPGRRMRNNPNLTLPATCFPTAVRHGRYLEPRAYSTG